MSPKALILGGSGFIGQYVAISFSSHHEVITAGNGADDIEFDALANPNQLIEILSSEKPDILINCIGTDSSVRDHATAFALNYDLSAIALRAAADGLFKPNKIVLIGSAAEYGKTSNSPTLEDGYANPLSVYGLSKLMQTRLAQNYAEHANVPVTVVRPFNVIGPNMPQRGPIGSFLRQALRDDFSEDFRNRDLNLVRDFVDVRDLATCLLNASSSGKNGAVYNCCSGSPTRMNEVYQFIWQHLKKSEKFPEEIFNGASNQIPVSIGSGERAFRDLHWKPKFSWKQSISDLISHAMKPL